MDEVTPKATLIGDPCINCGTPYDRCTALVLGPQRKACCGTCYATSTHNERRKLTPHEANLARVKALRDAFDGRSVASLPSGDVISCRLLFRLLADIEDVLTRHAPHPLYCGRGAWDDGSVCTSCHCANRVCPDYASALRLLDALDGGGSNG